MRIEERQIQDVTVIRLSGRVTLTDGADLLRETLQRLIGHGRTSLVLDFRDVPYIDSQAMAVLIRTQATLGRQGGGLILLQVSGHVRALLTVTGLSSVFEMFDTEADAVASFSPGGTAQA
jgi:anti-sigma B factor antagonist